MGEQRSGVLYGLRELILDAPPADSRAQLPLPIDLGPAQPATTDLHARLDVDVLYAVIEALPDAITLIHHDGRILLRNRAAFALLGAARSVDWSEHAIEQNPRHPDGRPYELEELPVQRSLLSGVAALAEPMVLSNITTGDDVPVLASSVPLSAPDGRTLGAAVIFRDLGPLLERDRERDAFVRLVGHEVQLPLTAIRGYLQHAMRQLEREGDTAPVRRSLDRADANVGRLVTLLRDVLDTSRQELINVTPERLELGAFVFEMHTRFDVPLQSRVRLATPEHVHVRADPRLLETILINLVDNARKYTDGIIHVGVARRGTVGVVLVQDEGPGIPDHERDVIFQPFRRGSNASSVEGSGLGLYLCRQLAARHGGELQLEPSPRGALFVLSLPTA